MGGEWFGLMPINVVEGSVHIVRGNMVINPHTHDIAWIEHRSYMVRYYRHRNEENTEHFTARTTKCFLSILC